MDTTLQDFSCQVWIHDPQEDTTVSGWIYDMEDHQALKEAIAYWESLGLEVSRVEVEGTQVDIQSLQSGR